MTVERPEPSISQDNLGRSSSDAPATMDGLFADVVMTLRFFSRLPTGDSPHLKPDLERMALALPFASLVIGIGPAALLLFGVLLGLPAYFAAALAVGASILVTGGMSEDAIADSADGLFGGNDVARRLEIMKDSRHGTYGVSALGLFVVLRVVGYGAIATLNPLAAAAIWLAGSVLGRSGGLVLPAALAAARPDGVGSAAGRLRWRSFVAGLVFALVLGVILAGPFVGYVGLACGLLFGGLALWGWVATCRHLVGGQTGDLTGAAMALCEIAALSGFLLVA